jgi:hypothetical protein
MDLKHTIFSIPILSKIWIFGMQSKYVYHQATLAKYKYKFLSERKRPPGQTFIQNYNFSQDGCEKRKVFFVTKTRVTR